MLIDLARERWTLRTLGRRRSSKFTLQSLSTSLSQSSSSSLLTQYCLRRAGKFATADTGFGLLWMQVLVNTADLEFYYSHLRTPGSFSPMTWSSTTLICALPAASVPRSSGRARSCISRPTHAVPVRPTPDDSPADSRVSRYLSNVARGYWTETIRRTLSVSRTITHIL